ncbi:DUF2793 domain-containing protein [Porphyrobacter sp. YT40]|uniref:DUF2793 domain-containing protein n=1 Tax=Porphyrobacter sp. YT40 TaxID=2547601 RepID=UPI00114462C2|nr:DUF2793 domain-containing protein [Porphyrobacter sp. YT40]QDH33267.1 DUF2793 domain-containing protein [Porphyrobacter sp. YT40]
MPAGQAQKEFFVNQALCLLDALHPRVVKASAAAPPAEVGEGDCFRVTAPASGAWSGREDDIAVRIGGDWHFVSPREGLQVFDQGDDRQLVFRTQWEHPSAPPNPVGGAVIDSEARAAIVGLIDVLATAGVIGASAP